MCLVRGIVDPFVSLGTQEWQVALVETCFSLLDSHVRGVENLAMWDATEHGSPMSILGFQASFVEY